MLGHPPFVVAVLMCFRDAPTLWPFPSWAPKPTRYPGPAFTPDLSPHSVPAPALGPTTIRSPCQVHATSDEKLNQPLLTFHDDATPELPLLAVNFDPALVRLLRETKYFLQLKIEVPPAAQVGRRHGRLLGTLNAAVQRRACCAPSHGIRPTQVHCAL